MGKKFAVSAVLVIGLGVTGAVAYDPARAAWQNFRMCQAQSEVIERDGAVVHLTDGSPQTVVLGDSYTAGDGLTSLDDRWAEHLGYAQGWSVDVDGVGSTGFLNGGACGDKQFSARLDGVLAAGPDVLIIQGGVNDWQQSPADVRAAASDLLDRAKDVPRVVVVGPAPAPSRGDLAAVDDALAAAAESSQREYISALGWDLEFLPDRLHMTPAGHAEYADRVAASLQR